MSIDTQLRRVARQTLARYRRFRQEVGEAGWGEPRPPEAVIRPAPIRLLRAVVVGAGVQGTVHAQAIGLLDHVEMVGLADLNSDRLRSLQERVGCSEDALFTDASEMFAHVQRPDLAIIATTAPSHAALAELAIDSGARSVLVEKPIDRCPRRAQALVEHAARERVPLAVNYSRRWLPDMRAIRECIQEGWIGDPGSVAAILGRGELAMHASHHLDLLRWILGPASAVHAQLGIDEVTNARGDDFEDPTGWCTVDFESGAHAHLDFLPRLPAKQQHLTIVGSSGRIVVDERLGHWELTGESGRTWRNPLSVWKGPVQVCAHALAGVLGGDHANSAAQALDVLDVVVAAHLSSAQDGRRVPLPLDHDDVHIDLKFA